ncbi:hypothetical protein GN958_ATG18584 [Phytophthora infestans]|uniref:Uncharacterized protein n=1 Tax=Phytophthora infestans TaxID=4787 RepID=A0A8S9TW16_PHYIN|nr:hypothetical protein GN958_ATG18584 [Phytophthora infestans]
MVEKRECADTGTSWMPSRKQRREGASVPDAGASYPGGCQRRVVSVLGASVPGILSSSSEASIARYVVSESS